MKPFFLFSLLILFTIPSSFAQQDHLLIYKKNNIKEVIINKTEKYTYEYHNGLILEKEPVVEKGNFVHHYHYFNNRNKKDSLITHTQEGKYSILSSNHYSYNDKDLLRTEKSKTNNIIILKKYKYNGLGHLDSIMVYKNNYKEIFGNNATAKLTPKEGFKFIYNAEALPLIEEQIFPADISKKTIYTYNSKNQLIKKIIDLGSKKDGDFTIKNGILHIIQYKYNKLGLKKKVTETYYIVKPDGKSEKDSQVKLKYKYKS